MYDSEEEEGSERCVESPSITAIQLDNCGQCQSQWDVLYVVAVAARCDLERVIFAVFGWLAGCVADECLVGEALVDDSAVEKEKVGCERGSPRTGDGCG